MRDAASNPGGQGFIRRHATSLSIAISLLALVAGVIALAPALVDSQVLRKPILKIADLNVTTKNDVLATDSGLYGEPRKRTVDAAAISIAIRNSGEEPALINRLRANVTRVWTPSGCTGGGPGRTSVAYDFVLPGTLMSEPLAEPLVLEEPVQFTVDGKAVDFLAVTIGQESIGEAEWPWITEATVDLVQDNGETLRTERVLLMDGTLVNSLVEGATLWRDQNPDVDDIQECVGRNLRMLEEALGRPGRKSPAITELHDRMIRAGFSPHPIPPPSTVDPGPPPGDGASDTWIAQLASLPQSTSSAEVRRARAEMAAETGLDLRILDSSEFASLTPGYWVIYHPGDFPDGHAALETCRRHGRTTEQSCVGRYLSHFEHHRDLVCRFSDSPGSRRCTRD